MSVPRDTPVQWADLNRDCFGCGPANDAGLQLESYYDADDEALVATFDPDPIYTSGIPNVMHGGTIASLIDCHSIWTAAVFTHEAEGVPIERRRIRYVTAKLEVEYLEATPMDEPIHLRGEVDSDVGRKVSVTTTLGPDGETTARGEVLAIEVSDYFS